MAWSKNGTTTLSSAGDTVTVSSLTATDFNLFLGHVINSTGSSNVRLRYNNNSNNVYAYRRSNDGGADGLGTSQSLYTAEIDDADEDRFIVNYTCSITGEEKLAIQFSMETADGNNNAPQRSEIVAKFVPSPDADITRIDLINGQPIIEPPFINLLATIISGLSFLKILYIFSIK